MFGMGMTLRVDDFSRLGRYPGGVVLGLTNQLLLLPAIGLAIAMSLPLRPELAVGLMILAACPGGATSNLVTHLSRGDTALSITLTGLSSLVTIVTIPFVINFSLQLFAPGDGKTFQLPVAGTIVNIVNLTAAPVAAGMWVHYRFPELTQRARPAIAGGSVFCILAALALMCLKLNERGNVLAFVVEAGPSALLLNICTLSLGFFSSRIFGFNAAQSISISFESGMQNGVLGMALATGAAFLNNAEMAVTSGVYGIVMCTTGLILTLIFRRLSTES
jgi:BASS family bile acid:Na+ symporter